MQNQLSLDQLTQVRGTPVYSSDGEKIGKVEEIFIDNDTRQPEWIGLGSGGMFSSKRVIVPVEGARLEADGFYVPYSKDQVQGTPAIDADEISQETERELYSYYGLGYSEQTSDSGLPEGGGMQTEAMATETNTVDTTPADTTDEGSITRAEEELRVGTRPTEAGGVRLRKWVETEPVQAEVELTRETARVEREPINQPVSGSEFGEQEIEVPLRSEEAVVAKEAVARERISVDKDVDTQVETVTDEVRRERVEIEGDDVEPRSS